VKLQFKRQKFQADAAKAVCDVFAGQPYSTPSYMIDKGVFRGGQLVLEMDDVFTGFGNERVVPELNKRYGWSKFIVVVPSVAIREGVYKSFQITEEHFRAMQPENARKNNVELVIDRNKLGSKEFRALWSKINAKTVYVVEFDEDELVRKAIDALNRELRVSKIMVRVEEGILKEIK
jgi:restriction endonuclease